MICNTYAPDPSLSRYIKSFILVEDDSQLLGDSWMSIYPSGHLEMIFSYGDDVHFSNGYYLRPGHAYLSGQILEPTYYRTSGSLKIISIIFKPWGIYHFLNVPQNELINSPIDLELLIKGDNNLMQRIADEENPAGKVTILNDYFGSLLNNMETNSNPVSETAAMILNSGGKISINDLCRYFNLNVKTLERKFKHIVGLTPKSFSKIIRFNQAFDDIKAGHAKDIHTIVYRHGYYDQSHFIKEFKKYTGLTPAAFLEPDATVSHSLREIVAI